MPPGSHSGGCKEREKTPETHICMSPGYKERKKRKKKKKNPRKRAYACPKGAKKMVGGQKCVVGVENVCWRLKTRAGGQDGGHGCSKTELGVKRCCWGSKYAAGGLKHAAGA
jgi:hypothetical protein